MNISPAYLITNPDTQLKTQLQLVGALWSLPVKGYFITQEQKDRLDKGDIPKPATNTGIVIEDMGSEWKISGNTYSKRDAIKQLGGKWQPSTKSWLIAREKADKNDLLVMLA